MFLLSIRTLNSLRGSPMLPGSGVACEGVSKWVRIKSFLRAYCPRICGCFLVPKLLLNPDLGLVPLWGTPLRAGMPVLRCDAPLPCQCATCTHTARWQCHCLEIPLHASAPRRAHLLHQQRQATSDTTSLPPRTDTNAVHRSGGVTAARRGANVSCESCRRDFPAPVRARGSRPA